MAQCAICGTEVVQGRGRARRTCSAACRQKAHRQKQARQVAELRAAATKPALDDSPAGRIRAAGAELAESIESAARHAAGNWSRGSADTLATTVRYDVARVITAILASAEPSRNEPIAAGTETATVERPTGLGASAQPSAPGVPAGPAAAPRRRGPRPHDPSRSASSSTYLLQ